MPLREDYTNTTPMASEHPDAHNVANDLVNTHTDQIAAIFTQLNTIGQQLGADPAGVFNNVQDRLNIADIDRGLNAVGVKVHSGDATASRPTGYQIIIWIGTVQPNNWQNNDIYVDVTP